MAYFPFYIDIKDKKILVVGGGKVALRKVEKLLQFEPKITVVAPFICDEIRKLGVSIIERKFIDSDIDDIFCAISATDDEVVNGHIFKLCSEKNILVNTVDDKDKCGFIFPALVNKNGITAGITSSGKVLFMRNIFVKDLKICLMIMLILQKHFLNIESV